MSFTRLPIFKFAFISATLGFSSNVTANETTLPYGSRAGMEVMITKKSGIGTSKASISIKHTPANAKSYCVEYELDSSKACVNRTLKEVIVKKAVTANCNTGQFTDVWGGNYILKGRSAAPETDFEIVDLTEGVVLDGSMASGYGVQLSVISALCPNLTR